MNPFLLRSVRALRRASFALMCGLLVSIATSAESLSTSTSMPNVSGTVLFGAQKAKMTHLYYQSKKTDDGQVLALLFSNEPLPLRALEDRQRLLQLARKKAFLGLYAELNEAGDLQQSELLYDDGAFTGPWRFEPPKGKLTTSAGRIATDEEREFFGKTFAVDVTYRFEGAVTNAWAGSPFRETKPTGLALGRAEGWIERLGKKSEIAHVVALKEIDLFGDSGERSLLLTAKPVTDAMFAAPAGPEQGLYQAGIAFLRVRIDGKGEVESVSAPTEDGMVMTFTSNQWDAEIGARTASEIDGSVAALEERDANSEFPRFQIRFHAPIRVVGSTPPVTEENGKALPKDGGEPGKAYRDFASVLKNAKSVDDLLPFRSAAMVGEVNAVPAEERAAMLAFLKEQSSMPLKIVGGFVNETQATLWLEGKQGREKIRGRVNVHRENDSWKLGAESFRITDSSEK